MRQRLRECDLHRTVLLEGRIGLASGEMDLGVHELKGGENEMRVTVVGANEKAARSFMFGLDYLLVKPAS